MIAIINLTFNQKNRIFTVIPMTPIAAKIMRSAGINSNIVVSPKDYSKISLNVFSVTYNL